MIPYLELLSKAYLTLKTHYVRFGVEPMTFEEFIEMGAKLRDKISNDVVLIDRNGNEMWIGTNGSIFFPRADGTSVLWGPIETVKLIDNLDELETLPKPE